MMNNHSTRWLVALVFAALVAGACGSDSEDGAAANKAEWDKKHASLIALISDDIDRSNQALSGGQRSLVLSACTQLQEDSTDAKKALPVPDATVHAALSEALEFSQKSAAGCIEGARVAGDAHLVEVAQADMKKAREKYDTAQDAIAAWS